MLFLIVAIIAFIGLADPARGLEGRELYDYMIAFMTVNWDAEQYQKAIQSILNSPQWAALDAQYGPWTVPPPPTELRRQTKK
jgi:hypothetical protein